MAEIITLPELPPEEQIGADRVATGTYSIGMEREVIANGCEICLHLAMFGEHAAHRTVPYVAWGGKHGELPATASLGITAAPYPSGYFRAVLFRAAEGVVNGFPPSAIAWYVLTRVLPPRWLQKRIMRWEATRR